MSIDYRLFIGGNWRGAEERDTLDVENPADRSILGKIPMANGQDLDDALEAVDAIRHSWANTAAVDRAEILMRVREGLLDRVEEVAVAITTEQGKPLREARNEVRFSAEIFRWAAEEARRIYGRVLPPRETGHRQIVLKQPVGPVAAFCAWNAPINTPARKIAPALAAGCPIILKGSEETPGAAILLMEVLQCESSPLTHQPPTFEIWLRKTSSSRIRSV